MNLRQLHYFRTLAKIEHYTQAAAQLSITQPSLSHAITELEKELGVFLFEKQGRNIRLTKYGKIFLTYVDSALCELEKGEKKIKKLMNPEQGQIDLAFIYTLGSRFIPTSIEAFVKETEYKDITFSFAQGTTKSIIQGLKDEKYDLAFCSYMENEKEIDFTPVAEQELVLAVHPDHPLAQKATVDIRETVSYPYIFYSKESGLRPLIDKIFKEENLKPEIVCEVEEDSAVAGLVSVNYGIAIMPRLSTIENQATIKLIKISNPIHKRFIYLASMKNYFLSPSVRLFRDFIIEFAKDQSHQLF